MFRILGIGVSFHSVPWRYLSIWVLSHFLRVAFCSFLVLSSSIFVVVLVLLNFQFSISVLLNFRCIILVAFSSGIAKHGHNRKK